jgi:hypothetical protein
MKRKGRERKKEEGERKEGIDIWLVAERKEKEKEETEEKQEKEERTYFFSVPRKQTLCFGDVWPGEASASQTERSNRSQPPTRDAYASPTCRSLRLVKRTQW